MNTLINRRIIIGITGGIAAYKSAELVRILVQMQAEVRVVMTRAACEFITPLTLQALSGKPVHLELMDTGAEAAMGHIELSRWADIILIAPASANFLANLANGQANDLLTTLCLATPAPILVAPAMNRHMWLNPATRDNVDILVGRGVGLYGPAEGDQACGDTGPGRMLEPLELANRLANEFKSELLSGYQVMVTAGPTREAIDPVRYISNRSSGRMGYAVARAAIEAGAAVKLISGPTALLPPDKVQFFPVKTASEMHDMVMKEIVGQDIFISTAAVSDYHCQQISRQKIKKKDDQVTLVLTKTPDILKQVTNLAQSPFTVGFAAETDNLTEYAKSKLENKNLDMIAANKVDENTGFESEENSIQLYWKDGGIDLGRASKDKLARAIIKQVAERYMARNIRQIH